MYKKLSNPVIALVALAFSTPALSALPTPNNIPACNIDAIAVHTPVVFPCSAIVTDIGNGLSGVDGVAVQRTYQHVSAAAVQLQNAKGFSNLKAAGASGIIPDRVVKAIGKPADKGNKNNNNDSSQTTPNGVMRVGAAPGALSVDGTGIGVAIVDTGIDLNHADLAAASDCFDAFTSDCMDGHGHGTHVAGTVAALSNSLDVVGVAPGATPYAVRVLDATGSGTDSTVMAGLDWVLSNWNRVTPNIRVVNMSLGRTGSLNDNPAYHSLVTQLADQNISVVVAAGNTASQEVSQNVPATYPEVFAIASTTATLCKNAGCRGYSGVIPADTASYFTTDGMMNPVTGIGITISAPGASSENIRKSCHISSEGILSLAAGGGTTRMSGTSMASPHVAGIVALMRDADIAIDNATLRAMLRATASGIGAMPYNSPTSSYSFDGEREGVASACGALGECIP